MSDVVVNNAPVVKEVKKRKYSSRTRDTSVGSKLKITVLKTKMNNLVVGGSGLVVDKNDIMKLDKDFEGDAIFPKINENTWEEISREVGPEDGLNDFGYEYITYKRRD